MLIDNKPSSARGTQQYPHESNKFGDAQVDIAPTPENAEIQSNVVVEQRSAAPSTLGVYLDNNKLAWKQASSRRVTSL